MLAPTTATSKSLCCIASVWPNNEKGAPQGASPETAEARSGQEVAPAVDAPAPAEEPLLGGDVVDVYSNSSSAPSSASRTFLRRPSLSASAAPAPTTSSSSVPRRLRLRVF